MPYTTDAMTVAKWFVERANRELVDEGVSEGVTNLKLQKLLYFAQAASLSLKNTPIFSDKIEAWKFGPVIPSVYNELRSNGSNPIKEISASGELTLEAKEILEDVWNIYGKYAAHELVSITHSHLPWKEVYFSTPEGRRHSEITQESMKSYYTGYYQVS